MTPPPPSPFTEPKSSVDFGIVRLRSCSTFICSTATSKSKFSLDSRAAIPQTFSARFEFVSPAVQTSQKYFFSGRPQDRTISGPTGRLPNCTTSDFCRTFCSTSESYDLKSLSRIVTNFPRLYFCLLNIGHY